jgi:hypothetical protein
MTGLAGLALLAGVLFWFFRGRTVTVATGDAGDLNYEEKEAAEELRAAEDEVRDHESGAQPEEETPGDDWGPGTARSY